MGAVPSAPSPPSTALAEDPDGTHWALADGQTIGAWIGPPVSPASGFASGPWPLKPPPTAFISKETATALIAEYPEDAKVLEDHVAGVFSTAEMRVERVALEDADRLLISGHKYDGIGAALVRSKVGFRASTSLGRKTKVEMAVRCMAAEPRPGLPHVALMLHGYEQDRSLGVWSRFWGPLLASGTHVVAVDWPGYGRSSGQDGNHKAWSDDLDGELLLRLVAALKLPRGCISVFAEGLGGRAFLRAMAQNPKPFAAHHVLFNVELDSVPAGLAESLEKQGIDILLCVCEMLHAGQVPWPVSNASALMPFLCNPGTMGMYGGMVLWRAADLADEKSGGKAQLGPSAFKSKRDGDWWTGRHEKIKGLTRAGGVLVFFPSEACVCELVQYINSPPQLQRPKDGFIMDAATTGSFKWHEGMQSFVRLKPLMSNEKRIGFKGNFVVEDTDLPADVPPQRLVVQEIRGKEGLAGTSHVVNRVLDDSHSQDDVYEAVVPKLLTKFLAGGNAALLAYGQTGQGKTHTIRGSDTDPGILPKCLDAIFKEMPSGKNLWYEYTQFRRDVFKDLLMEYSTKEMVVEEGICGAILPNLTRRQAVEQADVMKVVDDAEKNRPSGSHSVLILRLVDSSASPTDGPTPTLFIADLAGSECAVTVGTAGEDFAEAACVQQSLTALGRVMGAVMDSKIYSDIGGLLVSHDVSPFTMALKDALREDTRVAVIACVGQAEARFEHSLNSVMFASRTSHAKDKVARKEARDRQNQEKEAAEGDAVGQSAQPDEN